jgi:ABC-type uncharacterized transport system permease subunit
MTSTSATLAAPTAPPAAKVRRVSIWVWVALGFVLVSAARVITGAHELDSSGTLREAIMAGVPIALAGLGGLWSERAGVVNIGLEGMMIMGTLGAGYFGYWYGPWAGLLGGIAFGILGGALHALTTVVFNVDHIVSGVAINIIAAGGAAFLARSWFPGLPGGGQSQSPSLEAPGDITIDAVSTAARSIEDRHWFLVSDLASLVGALTKQLSLLTILAVLLCAATGWLLWRTKFGLRLRSCGESPSAAETLGVNVYRYKFVAVLVSGGLSGLAGAYIALVLSGQYLDGQTGGRGFIGLAAMIFGNWLPGGLLLGAGLFGFTDALQLRAGGGAVHALLIIIAAVLLALGMRQVLSGARRTGIVSIVIGALFALWFFTTDEVPADFTAMTPYLATLLVLALASQRLRMPAADGQRYTRGRAG